MWSRSGTKWLPLIGAAFVLLGVLMMLLGWRGAATTPLVFEQIPYLISGGEIGGALVTLGGLVYVSYWLTVLARDQRETHRLLAELLAQGLVGNREPAVTAVEVSTLVATARGDMVHRSDCPVVKDREGLRAVGLDSPGLKRCGICHPEALQLASGS